MTATLTSDRSQTQSVHPRNPRLNTHIGVSKPNLQSLISNLQSSLHSPSTVLRVTPFPPPTTAHSPPNIHAHHTPHTTPPGASRSASATAQSGAGNSSDTPCAPPTVVPALLRAAIDHKST